MNIEIIEANELKVKDVKIRKPLMNDLLNAERMGGGSDAMTSLALISQIATFDGQQLPPEDLKRLSMSSFLELSKTLESMGLRDLAKDLSSSSGTENSVSQK